jgi:hypothetical protein
VNNTWSLGNYFTRYSVLGGAQIEPRMQWQFMSGNWWLYLYRGTVDDAVGYYPGYIYNKWDVGERHRRATRLRR